MARAARASIFVAIGALLLRSRRLMRAPAWIYRARAGALFGSRILMPEHIGRRSGAPRYAVLEVVDHPGPDVYVVAPVSAEKPSGSATFRPTHGCVCTPAAMRRGAPPRASSTNKRPTARWPGYRGRHPRAWERFRPVLEDTLGAPITDTDSPLPMVELRLD